jgi:hypothetical protein
MIEFTSMQRQKALHFPRLHLSWATPTVGNFQEWKNDTSIAYVWKVQQSTARSIVVASYFPALFDGGIVDRFSSGITLLLCSHSDDLCADAGVAFVLKGLGMNCPHLSMAPNHVLLQLTLSHWVMRRKSRSSTAGSIASHLNESCLLFDKALCYVQQPYDHMTHPLGWEVTLCRDPLTSRSQVVNRARGRCHVSSRRGARVEPFLRSDW